MVFVPLAISFGAASPNVTSYTVLIDGAPDVFNVGAQTIATNGSMYDDHADHPRIALTIRAGPELQYPFRTWQTYDLKEWRGAS